MIAGDQDRGEGFVVAEKDVVAGAKPFDQIRFQQQRLGLGVRGDEFKPVRFRNHPPNAQGLAFGPGIGGDPFLQVLGLADVKDLAFAVEHPINAGLGRQARQQGADRLGAAARGGPSRILVLPAIGHDRHTMPCPMRPMIWGGNWPEIRYTCIRRYCKFPTYPPRPVGNPVDDLARTRPGAFPTGILPSPHGP